MLYNFLITDRFEMINIYNEKGMLFVAFTGENTSMFLYVRFSKCVGCDCADTVDEL